MSSCCTVRSKAQRWSAVLGALVVAATVQVWAASEPIPIKAPPKDGVSNEEQQIYHGRILRYLTVVPSKLLVNLEKQPPTIQPANPPGEQHKMSAGGTRSSGAAIATGSVPSSAGADFGFATGGFAGAPSRAGALDELARVSRRLQR